MSQYWVLLAIGILLIRTAVVVDSHEGSSRHSHRPGSPPHPPSSAGRHFPSPPPPTRLSPPPSTTTAPRRPRPTNGSSLSQRDSSSTIVVHHEDSPGKDAATIVILIFIFVLIALIIILAIPASKYIFNKLGWFGADERGDTVPSGSTGRRRSSLEIPTSDESSNEEELATTKEVTAISGPKSKRKGSGRYRSDQGEDREVIYHSHQDRVRGGRDATQQATAAPHLHGAAYMHGASFGHSQARGRQSKETPGGVHQQHRSRTGCSAGHDCERPEATYQMQDYDSGLEEMSREVHDAMVETEATVTISQQQSQSKGASAGDEIRMWMKHEVERRKEGATGKRADRQQQNSRTPPQALGPLNGAAPSIEEVISGAVPAPVAVNVDGRRLSWSGRSPAARSLNTSTMSTDERRHSSASDQPTSSRPRSTTRDNTTATNHEDYFSTGAEGESYQMVRRRSSTATAVSIVETGGIEVLNIAGVAGPDASDSGTAGLYLPSDRAATNRRRGSTSLVIETSGLENAQESPLRRRFENQLPNNSLGDVEFRNDPLQ